MHFPLFCTAVIGVHGHIGRGGNGGLRGERKGEGGKRELLEDVRDEIDLEEMH